ncbi:MAG TPA: type IV toxin-antitoxin system AbiEi family antitoxin domain-containing protein [Puia sp.]|nr:type IV toxin-antitoxin system AbiEi family antitoxin domain-containing protein [Puia sp.]
MLNLTRRQFLQRLLPDGMVIDRATLLKTGLDRHSIDNLVKSHQLEILAPGVYSKPESKFKWQGVISSLQSIYQDFTVGGLTAMELQGLVHYLPLSDQKTVHLYSRSTLPNWALKLLPNVKLIRHTESRLFGKLTENDKNGKNSLDRFTERYTWKEDNYFLTLSVPERAYLEVLSEVPKTISFEHADQLMQGLTNLTPYRLQELLELCNNVKVCRLFFWFAERHNYSWLKKLNREKINFGSGKRSLAKGGKFDQKYQITVPENL